MPALAEKPEKVARVVPNAPWPVVSLGEVVESMKNGIYRPASSYADDGLACLRMYNIGEGRIVWRDIKRMKLSEAEICEYELLPGDLLVNRVNSRELVGKTAVIPDGMERCVFESKNIRVRVNREMVEPKFVGFALLNSGRNHFNQNAQQVVGMASISQPQVASFKFPLPPLPEQRRIVAEIEQQFTRLDAGVAALRRTQANLKRYRAAVLKAACEGRLVPTEAELARGNARVLGSIPTGDFDSPSHGSNPHSRKRGSTPRGSTNRVQEVVSSGLTCPTGYETGEALLARIVTERRQNWKGRGTYNEPAIIDDTKLGPIPEGWAWATVEHLADIGSGNTPPKIAEHIQSVGPIPWFKVGDMNRPGNEQVMRSSESYLTPESANALGMKLFPAGSIIFPKRGGAIATNKKRLLEAPAATDLNVMSLTPHPVVFGYFKKWFASIDLASLSDGSNVPQVNNKDIQPLLVPLPPLAEQARIVAEVERRLSVVDELESVVKANLQRATRLRQSILLQAFHSNQ